MGKSLVLNSDAKASPCPDKCFPMSEVCVAGFVRIQKVSNLPIKQWILQKSYDFCYGSSIPGEVCLDNSRFCPYFSPSQFYEFDQFQVIWVRDFDFPYLLLSSDHGSTKAPSLQFEIRQATCPPPQKSQATNELPTMQP